MPANITHDLTLDTETVTKTYRHWARGEPRREWESLRLLHEHAPGLAPAPVSERLDSAPPAIVMRRLEGESLADLRVTPRHVGHLARAVDRLHTAVPPAARGDMPLRRWHRAEAVQELRAWVERPIDGGTSALARDALEATVEWLRSDGPDRLLSTDAPAVFTHGDGNLANFVWSESTGAVGIVDFEDAGRSDRAYEIADLTEHISMWVTDSVDTEALVASFDLDTAERARLDRARQLWASYWLLMLLPSGRAHRRNPEGTLERQARRVLERLRAGR